MSKQSLDTICIQGGWEPKNGEPRQLPIYQSTTFKYTTSEQMGRLFDLEENGYFYTRLANPTNDAVASKICQLEGGVGAMLTSSGQAATFYAILNICQAGDHVISSSTIYGGSTNLFTVTFPKMGVECTLVNPDADEAELAKAFRPNTKVVFAESIANPALTVLDFEKFARLAHSHGVPLIVDNTFATPYLFRPIEHGADVVVHSATKFIGGHGTSMGGVIVDGGRFDWAGSGKFPHLSEPNPSYHGVSFTQAAGPAALVTYIRAVLLRDTGAAISPFNAFILLQGLETLSLRVERHVANALKVVDYLSKHPKVTKVNHPALPDHPDHELYKKYFPKGAGSIFTFEIEGGQEAAWKFIDSLEIFSLLANVADVKSLVIHPYTTTHSQMTPEELAGQHITPSTVRLSVGTEYIDDIIDDLDQALAQV